MMSLHRDPITLRPLFVIALEVWQSGSVGFGRGLGVGLGVDFGLGEGVGPRVEFSDAPVIKIFNSVLSSAMESETLILN